MIYRVVVQGRMRTVEVCRNTQMGWSIRVDGGPSRTFDAEALSPTQWFIKEESGSRKVVGAVSTREGASLQIGGRGIDVQVSDCRNAARIAANEVEAGIVAVPMPGTVVRILVTEGEKVETGTPLIVVEAMKMENEFKAKAPGIVQTIHVKTGQTVDGGDELISLRVGSE